jgi:flagellar assembly protein FliH
MNQSEQLKHFECFLTLINEKCYMKQDFRKRVGYFLKKDDVLLKTMVLNDFQFADMNDVNVITHDNINKSIIHERLHTREDLVNAVKKSERFEEDIRDPDNMMAIITPEDFTKEWESQRKRAAKKIAGDIDMDEFLTGSMKDKSQRSRSQKEQEEFFKEELENPGSEKSNEVEGECEGDAEGFQTLQAEVVAPVELEHVDPFTHQKNNLDKVGKAISRSGDKLEEISVHAHEQESYETAVPAQEEQSSPPDTNGSTRLEEGELESIRRRGYEEGFKQGEEKATLELQTVTGRVVGDIEKIITDLQKVKSKVLHNIQDNFYEVCQALAEALIGREFQLDPQAFAAVINKAIGETIREDEFKIAVNAEFFEILQAVQDESFKKRLLKDDTVAKGDFRIDSKLSVVDGRIKELISDLLRETDMQIFAKKEAS